MKVGSKQQHIGRTSYNCARLTTTYYYNKTISETVLPLKDIYFVIYGIISEFTDKGQFQYLKNLKGPQEGTYLYTTQFLSLR